MKSHALPVSFTAALTLARLTFAASPSAPSAEEWPPIEPAPVVADGFQPTGWAEFQWRNDAWEPTRRQESLHDDHARVASVRDESWFMDKWQVSQVETMTYDDAGRLIEKVRQETVGVTLQNRGRFINDHHEAATIRETVSAWSHEQRWTPLAQEAYHYDDAGRLAEHTSNRFQGNLVRGVSQVHHRYDAAGRRTEALKQRDQAGKWVAAERVVFNYDDRGCLTQVPMFVTGKGGLQWMEGLRIMHEYDGVGRRTVTNRHTRGPADALEVNTRLLHFYDEHGNQIEKQFQQRRDGVWMDVRKETFSVRAKPQFADLGPQETNPAVAWPLLKPGHMSSLQAQGLGSVI